MKKSFTSLFKLFNSEQGFNLIEFIVVISIVIFLSGFVGLSLIHTQQRSSLHTAITQVISDIKQQQIKAMINDTESRGTNDTYGIYFQSNTYTLFHGATYSSSDLSNFTVNFDTNIQFTNISFPNSSIIFAKGTGEVVGFVNGSNKITITNTSGNEIKTMTVNKYGTITQVN